MHDNTCAKPSVLTTSQLEIAVSELPIDIGIRLHSHCNMKNGAGPCNIPLWSGGLPMSASQRYSQAQKGEVAGGAEADMEASDFGTFLLIPTQRSLEYSSKI